MSLGDLPRFPAAEMMILGPPDAWYTGIAVVGSLAAAPPESAIARGPGTSVGAKPNRKESVEAPCAW